MSYQIEYQWGAYRIDATEHGLDQDRFVIAIEAGANNCTEGNTNKRARDWNVSMIGTRSQVLKQTVYFAGSCEGGMLKPRNRDCTPEAYITRIRRLTEGPDFFEPGLDGSWTPEIRLDPAHEIIADVRNLGIEPRIEPYYSHQRAVVRFPPDRLGDYFHLIDRHEQLLNNGDVHAWALAQVYGLPKS